MKRSVVPLIALLFGWALLPIGMEAVDARRSPLRVYDAEDHFMGDVVDLTGTGQEHAVSVVLRLRVGGEVFPALVSIGPTGIFSFIEAPRFTTPDCTGTPWLPPPPMLPHAAISAPREGEAGWTLYLPLPEATPERLRLQSRLDPDGACVPLTTDSVVVPALVLIDLRELFTPPFRVR